MGKFYLFNPENDLALAAGSANYTPPAPVRVFHDAGACLPLWYAVPSGLVVAPSGAVDWMERKCREFGLECRVAMPGDACSGAEPWGWSAHAVHQLADKGVPLDCMPDEEAIARFRRLSHRRSALKLHELLIDKWHGPMPEAPVEADELSVVRHWMTETGGMVYMKSPWSSSGRGVLDCSAVPEAQVLRQAEGIIRRQGSVMIERRLDKVRDFAMLYYCQGGVVSHVGYSLFFTGTANAYGGNIVASDEFLLAELSRYVPERELLGLTSAVASTLGIILDGSGYDGYVGVDMMVYRHSSGELRIAPAVEINLRMTMGVVSWHLANRLLAPGTVGRFTVEYAPGAEIVDNYRMEHGRLAAGTMNLVPSAGNPFRFIVSVP